MRYRIRQTFSGLMLLGAILLSVLLGLGIWNPPSAAVAIRQLEEVPGQMVYQSRQTLKDQHGNTWQAIAFKRIRADGQTSFDLRLVGFPGVADIDCAQPLTLTDSLGKTLTASDDSDKIFSEVTQPASNVGQYDLQPLLSELQTEIPLTLTLPLAGSEPAIFSVSPSLTQEWRTVASQE